MTTLTTFDQETTVEILDPAGTALVRPKAGTVKVPHNPTLLARLCALLLERDAKGKPIWTISSIAKKLGINHSYVSVYYRQDQENPPEFVGDIIAMEDKLADFFAALDEKRFSDDSSFPTEVSEAMGKFIKRVRSVNGIGVLHGDAGLGKTIGLQRYRAENRLSIAVDVYSWSAGRDAVLSSLFRKLQTGYNRQESRAEWMVQKLRGWGGVLLFDNAHKLTMSALGMIFDLHDRTEVPIVLVGNPSIIDKLRTNDQLFSRVGLVKELKYSQAGLATAVGNLLEREMTDHAAAILPMAARVAKQRGHLRSLNHHLRVTRSFLENPKMAAKPIAKVFEAVHQTLIHESYSLTEDAADAA